MNLAAASSPDPQAFGLAGAIRPHAGYREFPFEELGTSPLVIDAVYSGGRRNDVRDDPISRLMPGAGNQGGFRAVGGSRFGKCRALVIYTSGEEIDWPDKLDLEQGTFTYYGDNRKPGRDLHDTSRGGNALLREMFGALQGPLSSRWSIPPTFIFSKHRRGRSVQFRGLAVPGLSDLPPDASLVAIWRQSQGNRFQNYRAVFSVLATPPIRRDWIDGVLEGRGKDVDDRAPEAWRAWRDRGHFKVLRAPAPKRWRSRSDQLPAESDLEGRKLLTRLHDLVRDHPTKFEHLAVAIFRLAEPRITAEVTRPSVDGGRDAVGELTIGGGLVGGITLDFALEAKAYQPAHSVGTKETSRLISRLRHRQFGVLVTTSYVAQQAYEELTDDRHPVVIISGGDIVKLLRQSNLSEVPALNRWAADVLRDAI
jgi:hypothetical protein